MKKYLMYLAVFLTLIFVNSGLAADKESKDSAPLAASAAKEEPKITITLDKVPLMKALNRIFHLAKVKWKADVDLKDAPPVTLTVSEPAKLSDILEKILLPCGLSFKIDPKGTYHIVQSAAAAKETSKGAVKDKKTEQKKYSAPKKAAVSPKEEISKTAADKDKSGTAPIPTAKTPASVKKGTLKPGKAPAAAKILKKRKTDSLALDGLKSAPEPPFSVTYTDTSSTIKSGKATAESPAFEAPTPAPGASTEGSARSVKWSNAEALASEDTAVKGAESPAVGGMGSGAGVVRSDYLDASGAAEARPVGSRRCGAREGWSRPSD